MMPLTTEATVQPWWVQVEEKAFSCPLASITNTTWSEARMRPLP
jgi:hypothetical protein